MPSYSQHSEDKLNQASSDIQKVFRQVIKTYDHTVVDTYRPKALQEQYFDEGKSKVHYPTVHNARPARAIDAYPYMNGMVVFGNTPEEEKQCIHFAAYVMGTADLMYERGEITHRFRNGRDWDGDKNINDQTFMDTCHFEEIPNPGEIIQYFET